MPAWAKELIGKWRAELEDANVALLNANAANDDKGHSDTQYFAGRITALQNCIMDLQDALLARKLAP